MTEAAGPELGVAMGTYGGTAMGTMFNVLALEYEKHKRRKTEMSAEEIRLIQRAIECRLLHRGAAAGGVPAGRGWNSTEGGRPQQDPAQLPA